VGRGPAKPVAHAVSFVDEQGRAVTALIVGDQAGRAIMEGKNLCPRWTEHDVSDPRVTLSPPARSVGSK
jgi:hypothetical protein